MYFLCVSQRKLPCPTIFSNDMWNFTTGCVYLPKENVNFSFSPPAYRDSYLHTIVVSEVEQKKRKIIVVQNHHWSLLYERSEYKEQNEYSEYPKYSPRCQSSIVLARTVIEIQNIQNRNRCSLRLQSWEMRLPFWFSNFVENVAAEHINLSLVEFELFCGEKDEERELREEKVGQLSLTRF